MEQKCAENESGEPECPIVLYYTTVPLLLHPCLPLPVHEVRDGVVEAKRLSSREQTEVLLPNLLPDAAGSVVHIIRMGTTWWNSELALRLRARAITVSWSIPSLR